MKAKIGILLGILATPVVCYLSAVSGGLGHGNYFWARIFFPILSLIMASGAGLLVIPFALIQYPVFGWYIGHSIAKRQFLRLSVVMAVLQIIPMTILLAAT